MSYKALGKLIVSRNNKTNTASLDRKLEWHSRNKYLRQYLNQIHSNYPTSLARAVMKSAKRDLEYGGYSVELVQSHGSIISDIINRNSEICDFWSSAHGWAPNDAAELLAKSRLDWQVSLSYCLRLWLEQSIEENTEGRLILAWTNLVALVEGTMKFFLSVHEGDYSQTPVTRGRDEKPRDIDALQFEELRQFYNKNVWRESQRKWDNWLSKIQIRRNAIHAYRNRYIGTFDEFFEDIGRHFDFLEELEGQVPYP
jgi:hypothetical protein